MNENRTPAIRIKNLQKSFGKGRYKNTVLKGVDLEIKGGQIIGYIGPNGAGKSTTVKILCGMITDFEGEVHVKGINLKTGGQEVKSLIGYVPENTALYESLSPYEYFDLLGALYGIDKAKAQLRTQQLMQYFEMDKYAGQRMESFSKGMKQKILIISGLINNPDILFLDEPLSGLDANSVILVKELLVKLAQQGKTIFYCSHLMDVVEKISDRIVLINEGVVIADGTFEELRLENASLEQVFARLTGKDGGQISTSSILESFN